MTPDAEDPNSNQAYYDTPEGKRYAASGLGNQATGSLPGNKVPDEHFSSQKASPEGFEETLERLLDQHAIAYSSATAQFVSGSLNKGELGKLWKESDIRTKLAILRAHQDSIREERAQELEQYQEDANNNPRHDWHYVEDRIKAIRAGLETS